MKLYLDGKKYKININGVVYRLNMSSNESLLRGVRLSSLDGYILKDSNGLYIMAKEGE